MKLTIKNRLITLRGGSTVTDENGQLIYKVKGRVFSITKKKFVHSADGQKLFMVRNKYWNIFFHSALIYDDERHYVGKLKFDAGSFQYVLQDYEDEVYINCKIGFKDREMYRAGKLAATYRPIFNIARDTYSLDVQEGEDPAFWVAIIIALDNIGDRGLGLFNN